MAITNMDSLVSAMNSGQINSIYKTSVSSKGAGYFQSLWTATGLPCAGTFPNSVNGAICTLDTIGALTFANPTGTEKSYLGRFGICNSLTGTLIIYDRLWHNSNLNGTLTTPQTFSPPILTRYSDGIGVEAFIEVYTPTGSTQATATLTYTNTNLEENRIATASLIASPVSGQMIRFMLQNGDKGITTCSQLSLSVSTGIVGNFGITFVKRIAEIPITSTNIQSMYDVFALGMPEIKNNACLSFIFLGNMTFTGTINGSAIVIQG